MLSYINIGISVLFVDYLYRVESKQPGTKGGGKSSWFNVRSGEGGKNMIVTYFIIVL